MIKHKKTLPMNKTNITTGFSMTFVDDEINEDKLFDILTDYEKEIIVKPYVTDYKFDIIIKNEPKDVETVFTIGIVYSDVYLEDIINKGIIKNKEKDFMDIIPESKKVMSND